VKARATLILILAIAASLCAFGQDGAKPNVKISCPRLQSHPVKIVLPVYPELARQTQVEGRVSLDCIVGTDGLIQKIEVKKGHPLLIQAATDAVSQWKFKPMVLNGKAVEMETVVDVDFQLSPTVKADGIVVEKALRMMKLMRDGRVLRTYKVALSTVPIGPKEREGDHKVPEGHYIVDAKNLHSRFHLALHNSYPKESDRLAARKKGFRPGGDI
jgi:TonB family protein